jgi:ATP adenylyltransferase
MDHPRLLQEDTTQAHGSPFDPRRERQNGAVSLPSAIEQATRRALATGALAPTATRALALDDGGVRFVVRVVSGLARKAVSAPVADPLGDYDPDLFVADLAPSHYVLLNKFPVIPGHLLIVTRRNEGQERLLSMQDFDALLACLREVDGLVFYNGGPEAGASQAHKHLQLVPLPLGMEGDGDVPIERVLGGRPARLPFRHAFEPVPAPASAAVLHALYRELLSRVGIAAVPTPDGEVHGAPYNLLVHRQWMLVVPRSRGCFGTIPVNALGYAGSLFLRSQEDLERVRAAGPMRVLRDVAIADGT